MGCSNSTNDASTKDDVKQNYNNLNQNKNENNKSYYNVRHRNDDVYSSNGSD